MPTVCERVKLPGGGVALVRRHVAKCRYCSKPHTRLCDWPIGGGKTCDLKLCDEHAKHDAIAEVDFCPEHP